MQSCYHMMLSFAKSLPSHLCSPHGSLLLSPHAFTGMQAETDLLIPQLHAAHRLQVAIRASRDILKLANPEDSMVIDDKAVPDASPRYGGSVTNELVSRESCDYNWQTLRLSCPTVLPKVWTMQQACSHAACTLMTQMIRTRLICPEQGTHMSRTRNPNVFDLAWDPYAADTHTSERETSQAYEP